MTKESTEPAAAAADIVPSPLCRDDATKTCREFTLEAIGQTDRCRSRRRKEARPAIVSAAAASPELLDCPRRRPFTAQDKLRILAEAYRSVGGAGGIGAIVRRDGLSVAALPNRRRQPAAGVFVALGRPSEAAKPPNKTPLAAEFAQSRRDNLVRKPRLERAEAIIELQKSCGT